MYKPVNLSSLLGGAIDELREQAQSVAIYLAIVIPTAALSFYFESNNGQFLNTGLKIDAALLSQGPLAVGIVIAAFIIGLVAYYWFFAAMVKRTMAPGFDRLFPFIGIYILSMLGIGLGLILLIIPGIILSVIWCVVLPLVIDREDGAMKSFGESIALVSGHGWQIFFAYLIIFVGVIVASSVTGGFSFAFGGVTIIGAVIQSALEAVSTILFIALSVTAYRQLKDDSREIAEVFE